MIPWLSRKAYQTVVSSFTQSRPFSFLIAHVHVATLRGALFPCNTFHFALKLLFFRRAFCFGLSLGDRRGLTTLTLFSRKRDQSILGR